MILNAPCGYKNTGRKIVGLQIELPSGNMVSADNPYVTPKK